MLTDLTSIGLRPTVAGAIVLVAAVVTGWGLSAHRHLRGVRLMAWWVQRVALRVLHCRRWLTRALLIVTNNAAVCALLVLAGKWEVGAWLGVTAIGLALGAALGLLINSEPGGEREAPGLAGATPDGFFAVGLLLNLLEVPAILATVGLSIGQSAVPNSLPIGDVWRVFGQYVLPVLIVAAAGEALWLGRRRD